MRVCGDCVIFFAVLHKSSAQPVGHVFQPCFVFCVMMHCQTRPCRCNHPRRCCAPWGFSLRPSGKLCMYVTIHPFLLHPRYPVIDCHVMMNPKAFSGFRSVKYFFHIISDHSAHARVKSLHTKKRHQYRAAISSRHSTRVQQKVCNRQRYVRQKTVE